MPNCSICGQDISEEQFIYFEGKCIVCIHELATRYGLKCILCICIAFLGTVFFIISFITIMQITLDISLGGTITFLETIPIVIIFHLSRILIYIAIKKFRSPMSLSDLE